MPKTREQKTRELQAVRERLGRARGALLAEFTGLTVAELFELRRRFREEGVELKVVKNTLARLAGEALGLTGMAPFLKGPTMVAFGYDDPVAAARALVAAQGAHEGKIRVKAGLVEGRMVGPDEVEALAKLPPRAELLGMVAGGFKAPLAGVVATLGGLLRGFAVAADALRRQREQAA